LVHENGHDKQATHWSGLRSRLATPRPVRVPGICGIALVGLHAALAAISLQFSPEHPAGRVPVQPLTWILLAASGIFLAADSVLRSIPPSRRAVAWVVGIEILLRLGALLPPYDLRLRFGAGNRARVLDHASVRVGYMRVWVLLVFGWMRDVTGIDVPEAREARRNTTKETVLE
jgi:hypothetical protein